MALRELFIFSMLRAGSTTFLLLLKLKGDELWKVGHYNLCDVEKDIYFVIIFGDFLFRLSDKCM